MLTIKKSLNKLILVLFIFLFCSSISAQNVIISPSPLYMGKIPIGSTAEREVTIFNTTVNQVTVNSISISGTNAARFTIVNNPGSFTLGAIAKREVIIRYEASAAVINTAQLNIQSSAGSFSANLEGYGIPSFGGVQAFERILGTSEADGASEIQQTSDGGFIIVGNTTPPNESYPSVYLIKTDVNGRVEWTSVYGDEDGPDTGADVEQTADGGYLVVGTTDNWGPAGTNVMLLKFNASGEYVWRKTYGSGNDDAGSAMVATQDGGYALVGQTVPTSGVGKTVFLVKVSANGTEQWQNTYGGSSGTDASDIIQLDDGSFLMTGYLTVGNDFQVYVIKTNSSGGLIWEKNYGGGDLEYGYSIYELSDGNIIVSGYTASKGAGARDGYLIKMNSNGDLIWDKAYGYNRSDEFRSVVETAEGNLIAVGNSVQRVTDDEQFTDAYMIKTDANGNENWSYLFGGDLNEGFSEIHRTNDGGYITVGGAGSYSKSSDVYVVKTSDNGTVSDVNDEREDIVNNFELHQNYPNPFNPETKIRFSIPAGAAGKTMLKVYDILGNEVATLINEEKGFGSYEVNFNAARLSSGVYFYQLTSGDLRVTRKMILIK